MSSTKNDNIQDTNDDFYLIDDNIDANFIENGRNFLNKLDSIEASLNKEDHSNNKTDLQQSNNNTITQ